jgi:hypothetical protein
LSDVGSIGNAVRLHYAATREQGGLANLFKLIISPAARRKQFERQQETQKQALRKRQAQSRNERAATKARHASEVAAQKMVWRQLAAEREKVWSEYRREFATQESQDKADQQQSHRARHWRLRECIFLKFKPALRKSVCRQLFGLYPQSLRAGAGRFWPETPPHRRQFPPHLAANPNSDVLAST